MNQRFLNALYKRNLILNQITHLFINQACVLCFVFSLEVDIPCTVGAKM